MTATSAHQHLADGAAVGQEATPPLGSEMPTRRTGDGLLGVVLSVLTIFGPISMDLYSPVLPALTRELGASTSAAQLTVTACLIGLAVGQLVAGPISDRYGRRRPLLIGVAAFIAASLLCAVASTITTLVAVRLVQGLAGGVGIVIAQAAGRDLYSGATLMRYYGRLTVLGGLAAVVGPVVGGQLWQWSAARPQPLWRRPGGLPDRPDRRRVVPETAEATGESVGFLTADALIEEVSIDASTPARSPSTTSS